MAEKVNDVWQFVIYDAFGKIVAEYGGTAPQDEGGVKYYLQDWQGSVRAGVNAGGFVKSRTDHQTFGEEIASGIGLRTEEQGFGAPQANRQGYGLTEKDSTGLGHTWFRKNENRAGRWTSPDPYNGSASVGNPQSWNRYSYVGNQPTNYVDPSGLNPNSGYFLCYDIVTTGHYENQPGHGYTFLTTRCIVFGGGNTGVGTIDPGGFGSGGGGGDYAGDPPNRRRQFPCPPNWNQIFARGAEKLTAALQAAWNDGRANNREEGGWIYMNHAGNIMVRRAEPTAQTAIGLGSPPAVAGWIVVANFHTHDSNSSPSPTVPGFVLGDVDVNESHKIPGLILGRTASGFGSAEDWTTYGPEQGYFGIGVPGRCNQKIRASAGAKASVRR